jgi:NADH-quinone oxidoreductase subunit N
LAIAVLLLTAGLVYRASQDVGIASSAFGGMFVNDGVATISKIFILISTALVFVFSKPYLIPRKLFQGEFYTLILFAVLGMMFLASAGNMLTAYLGLELLALPSYALVALDRDNGRSSEAAIKYFVLGALASGMLLYGISMIYGATGALDFGSIRGALVSNAPHPGLLVFGLVFLIIGIAFKFGAAPFHMWVPDVYQGAPTAVTMFIGSAPKIAAFALAYRLLEDAMAPLFNDWRQMLAVLALLSLAIGNLIALTQTNLKRMLAYSTISHIGFLLLGFIAGTIEGYAASLFYAITYSITATASFGLIVFMSRSGFEAEEIEDFRGLNQRNGWYALMVLLVMASLAGVPLFVGFLAKLQVLKAAVGSGALGLWLALAAGVFAVIGAFYYLRVMKAVYFDEPMPSTQLVLPADMPFRVVLSANVLALVGLGIFGGPLMSWCIRAVSGG